ncbi:MAG: TerB family tellurite resistance protein, partial [Spirosomaceae bacterium]|nr:TerB family tellurite resistance protein [Spirosomataceae bacterium]
MNYSPGVLSVLPIFYIGWSDSVLSPSEMQQIRTHIQKAPQLTQEDKLLLISWTDQRNPPDEETFTRWATTIAEHGKSLSISERQNLVELGVKMASKATSANAENVFQSLEVRASIKQLEQLLGVNNSYSKVSFYNAIFPENKVEINESPAFDSNKLQAELDGPLADLKNRTKQVLKDEFFRVPTDLLDKDKLRLLILDQC